jgi:ATP-dependent Clp protease adaptor protein ClpS
MNGRPAKGTQRYTVVQLDLQREAGNAVPLTKLRFSVEEAESAAITAPHRIDDLDIDEVDEIQRPWQVVVWNDPVNLMSYVVFVFRKLFGFPEEKATRLMLAVHHEGRAVVASGPREKSELDCYRLHHHGLWATLEKA